MGTGTTNNRIYRARIARTDVSGAAMTKSYFGRVAAFKAGVFRAPAARPGIISRSLVGAGMTRIETARAVLADASVARASVIGTGFLRIGPW